jgi:excisionase family DNA binding protein
VRTLGCESKQAATNIAVNNRQPIRRLLYSKKESAELLSVSVRTISYMIDGGALESRSIGRRVLIPYSSLESFAKKNHRGRVQ